jgi:hypothetical protein
MATKRTKQNDMASPAASAAAPARRKSAAAPRSKHGLKRSTAAAPEAETQVETVPVQPGYVPAENEIAVLAYTYWVDRGCQGGSPEEDWLRAERELRAKNSA